jgi:hypothetical protein
MTEMQFYSQTIREDFLIKKKRENDNFLEKQRKLQQRRLQGLN